MRTNELRNMTAEELAARLTTLEQDYFSKSEHVRTGKEKNHAQLKQLRHDIARVKTLLPGQRRAA